MSIGKASLISRLNAASGLSTSQRRIADCLLGRLGEAAFWGVEELAERSQSSVATVVRFAQKLGYSGFLELRQALVAQAKKQSRGNDTIFQPPAEAASTLVEVARRDIHNIELMVGSVNEALLEGVVTRLFKARHRLLLGAGLSSLMSRQLAYLFTQAGLPCLEGSAADYASQVVNLDTRDVLVAIAFQPYHRDTLDAAAFAKKRDVPIIAFTDKLRSPLAKLAEFTFPVPGENLLYSHSLAAFAVLAHAIATAITAEDRESALKKQREAERAVRPVLETE